MSSVVRGQGCEAHRDHGVGHDLGGDGAEVLVGHLHLTRRPAGAAAAARATTLPRRLIHLHLLKLVLQFGDVLCFCRRPLLLLRLLPGLALGLLLLLQQPGAPRSRLRAHAALPHLERRRRERRLQRRQPAACDGRPQRRLCLLSGRLWRGRLGC